MKAHLWLGRQLAEGQRHRGGRVQNAHPVQLPPGMMPGSRTAPACTPTPCMLLLLRALMYACMSLHACKPHQHVPSQQC